MILGIDCSHWQPATLPWAAWRDRVEIVVIQTYHGDHVEKLADVHLANALWAGYSHIGAYAWLYGGNGAGQCAEFLKTVKPEFTFCALDVEQAGVWAADVLDWCSYYDAHETRPLVLYGNNALASIMGAHPELRRYGVWWARYPTNAPASAPPPNAGPNAPAGLRVVGWQFAGDGGRLPPYAGAIDLTEWYQTPGAQPVSNPTGCLIGGGAESNSDIIPIYIALAQQGAVPPIIIGVENPGLCVDAKKIGVPTTITRFLHPETGPDHDFEAGGSGRLGWDQAKRLRFARASIALPFNHMNPTEAAAVDYVQCAGNEWDAQDVGEWLATCDVWSLVLDERDNRQAEYIAKYGKPLKLAMGIFNAGTPKTWEMYVAIFSHPVFKRMHDAGDFIGFHEGVAFGQPKDYLYNVPLDRAPHIEGAGLVNFRSDYALAVLAAQGWECAYGFLEFYDGFTRDDDASSRIDVLQWMDQHLGTQGPATRKFFRGLCCFEFTNNPASSWYRQDFTPVFRDPRWTAYAVSQKGRINGIGVPNMPNVTDADYAALVAANTAGLQAANLQATILAKYRAHVWRAGDVAVAVANPLQLYSAPGVPQGVPRPNVTYDINVVAVSPDLHWLQVTPTLWCQVSDVKFKGT